jgi:branched-chain amino acid transport system ATP-binding protein
MSATLVARQLSGGHGHRALFESLDLSVAPGDVVGVVGANGAGKTTLLSTIAGLLTPTRGRIVFRGQDITAAPAHDVTALGLATVPEGGRLFPFMTVEENLKLGGYVPSARAGMAARMDEVTELFPILRERRRQLAGKLSGGERQMCAIARAVMSRPTLLMLDEPSVGLSPLMVGRVFEIVEALARREALTVVLVEQNVSEALDLASRAYVLDHGSIVRGGAAADLRGDRAIQETYMGL